MPKPSSTHQKPVPTALAVAACSMALTAGRELQLMPAGSFSARDGRPADAPSWFIDAALAHTLIAAAHARVTPYVIDYEHQTLFSQKNGQPAPAAGWFKALEWRDGIGLFATDVEWTDRAESWIASKEYKFISPVIGYDKVTGAVTVLHMAAITNNPAVDGMDAVLLSAALLHFSHPTPLTQELPMDPELLEQLRWMLNLPIAATAADIKAELQKLANLIKEDPTVTAAASFDLAAWITAQRGAVASLSATAALGAGTPDPSKFVPIATMTALQSQIAQLSAEVNGGRLDTVIKDAIAARKLLPAQEAWAREFGGRDLTALSSYIASAPPIAFLAGMQTGGLAPAGSTTSGLTPNQVALCAATGVSHADFLKTAQGEPA